MLLHCSINTANAVYGPRSSGSAAILETVTPAATPVRILKFAAFELDLVQEELRRGGLLIKLSPQQFRILRFLVERAGQICSRDDIQRAIWGSETFVDYDRSLNVSIAQIRAALNDDSEAPRFIQTVPRRGYRFLAPVDSVTTVTPAPAPRPRLWWAAFLAPIAAAVGAIFFLWRSAAPVPRTMIAVLPFANTTHQESDGVLLEGLLDEMITQFGTLLPDRMGAIGRTSVLRYAGQNAPLPRIGADLGVNYIVEGDLRRQGDVQRVSIRLVKVADQAQVWNDTYQFSGAGSLEFQEDAAARASAAVVRALFPQATGRQQHRPSASAYEAFVNGRYLQHKRTAADSLRALEWFAKSGALDTSYAEPWAAGAEAYIGQALSGAAPAPESLEKARDAATRALRIDESNAEAHNALGSVAFWRDWDFAAARREFERALNLNPSLAQAYHDYAFVEVVTGHPEAGVASLKRALVLDPLSPRVNVDAGWVLLQAHRFDEAIRSARRALELEPGLREAQACIARAELYQGKRTGQAFFESDLSNPDPYRRALAAAELGRTADALAALKLARAQHHLLMPLAATEPAFAALHRSPEFQNIIIGPSEERR
jgi:DNA-binding winged helix-turn-helix (wHTH) protein/TolB-like protein/Tfp pilus assembly protein PilF